MDPSQFILIHTLLYFLGTVNSVGILPSFGRSGSESGGGSRISAGALHNTPPSFSSHRDWIVDEDHRVGERVFAVKTIDPDGDPIRFSLAPALFRDGSSYFRVDSVTGEVFLVKPFKGMGGQDLYMYVRADDGHHQAKVEVSIRVIRTGQRSAHERKNELDAVLKRPSISDIEKSASAGNNVKILSPSRYNTSNDDDEKFPEIRGSLNENSSNTLTPMVIIIVALFITTIGGIQLFRRKWAGLRKSDGSEEKIKSKGSIFHSLSSNSRNNACKDTIALARLPSQPSWAAVLEKREPVLKPAEFFSTLTDDKWEFPRNKLKFLQHISQGCFGQVWKCEAFQSASTEESRYKNFAGSKKSDESSIIVAVKTLKDHSSDKGRQDLLNELGIMKLLDPHPNIVTLLGCCTEKDPLFVIMEYISLGKLQTFLRNNRRPMIERGSPTDVATLAPLTSMELTQFGYQVAKGMEYIASKGIVHRDLAARNVLVTESRQCKANSLSHIHHVVASFALPVYPNVEHLLNVADFGLARDVISSHEYERKGDGVLPVRWMPPEALYDNVHTTKSDVWAFGILLWEIVTLGSTPYPGMTAMEVTQRVREGYRLEKPEHCKREIYNIMSYCWEANPSKRPCFTELTHMLEKLIVSENDYIELERFPEHAYYNVCQDLPGEKL